MNLTRRAYRGQADWDAVAKLIMRDPKFHHPIDFPWRLTSPSLDDPLNGSIWVEQNGEIRAFASLQFAWLTLDYAIDPEAYRLELESEILGWGEERLRQIAIDRDDHFPFNVNVYSDESDRITYLEQRGYSCWDNYVIVFNRSMQSIAEPRLPEGFSIRPLGGNDEVHHYVNLHRSAFDSTFMTDAWRQRTLAAPLYNPALDLVAVAPDGRLAGFIICWFQPQLKMAQIEPMGVHPDFQHLGLSQALIHESFHRVAVKGCETIRVETYNFNEAGIRAYESAGFQAVKQKRKYYLDY
jgi:ribosomal protein S18 acetylase RimI-like enzyme